VEVRNVEKEYMELDKVDVKNLGKMRDNLL
jgi:hypothetical protein